MSPIVIPRRHALQLLGLWMSLVAIAIYGHSYVPIDETRYVTVAWEMWLRGDFLVPYLNGEPYSHKPPLLFWLMQAGWALFGVNDWWPRVMPSLFALGSAWLTMRLAARLWPERKEAASIAPLILMGSLLWALFTAETMFDMLVAFFTLAGMHGLVSVWRGKARKGWLLVGLALGGGMLAKGPVVLMLVLLPAVLAPWWGQARPQRWSLWYLGLLGSVVLGLMIVLVWALPAGLRGGEEYRNAIFWGQTAGRMVESFAHRRPLWWYLPLLPILLLPWSLWPPLWRGIPRLRTAMGEPGVRLCLAWMVPVLVAFSLISGKQVHYLLPIFPAFALLAARALVLAPSIGRRDAIPLSLLAVIASLMLVFLPHFSRSHSMASWFGSAAHWGAVACLLGGLLLLMLRNRDVVSEVWKATLFSACIVAALYIGVMHRPDSPFDVRQISLRLKQLEDAGVPLAHVGEYPGIFNFLGRLKHSPEVMTRAQLTAWFEQHPDGRAVVYFDKQRPLGQMQPEYLRYYMDRQLGIVNREQWRQWCTQWPERKDCASR